MKKIKSVLGYRMPVASWFLSYILASAIVNTIENKITVFHLMLFSFILIPLMVAAQIWLESDSDKS
jgi:hypothetical protein